MEGKIYRPQVRLHYDRPDEMAIVKKIENRNKALYKSVNDYIIHAIYAFEATEASKTPAPNQQERTGENIPKRAEDRPLENDIASFLGGEF